MSVTASDSSTSEPYEGHIAERYLLISWCSFVLLGCLIGNTIILIATALCKTIRLDKTSLILIKNIAVSDITMGIVAVHPTLASLIHGTWPYGTVLCYTFNFLRFPVYLSAVLLICGLHLNKLHIAWFLLAPLGARKVKRRERRAEPSKLHTVIYPLRSVYRTKRAGHVISAIVWMLCSVIPATQIIVDYRAVVYSRRAYRCVHTFEDATWDWLLPLLVLVFTALPNILVVGTTAALAFLVRKTKGRFNRQGILVALYAGCLYLLANVPISVYMLIYKNFHQLMSPDVKFFFGYYVRRTATFLVFSNCFCNFFVYFHTVKSFNAFVKRGLSSLIHGPVSRSSVETFRLRTLNKFLKNSVDNQ